MDNDLLEALKLIQSMKLSMLAHPDCEKDSEFDNLTSLAEDLLEKWHYYNIDLKK